jgi:hypothetical protein
MDPARVPVNPKERASRQSGLMAMVRKDLEKGVSNDWGAFVGEERGYVIVEGGETEVSLVTQQYTPYAQFEAHAIMSAKQIEDMVKKSLESDYPVPETPALRPIHGFATAISRKPQAAEPTDF